MYCALMSRTGSRLAVLVFILVSAAACQSGPDLGQRPDLGLVCAEVRTGAPNCLDEVTRLNSVLTAVLDDALPSGASAVNNLRGTHGPVGGTGPTFHPRVVEGDLYYEAPVRLREKDKAANLTIVVDRWLNLPEGDSCLMPAEAIAGEKAKGAVVHRCDRTVDANGSTVLVSDISRPYGSGGSAKVLARDFHVTVFRKDQVVVTVGLDTIVEKAPDPAKHGDLPTMLTLEQLLGIGANPALRI